MLSFVQHWRSSVRIESITAELHQNRQRHRYNLVREFANCCPIFKHSFNIRPSSKFVVESSLIASHHLWIGGLSSGRQPSADLCIGRRWSPWIHVGRRRHARQLDGRECWPGNSERTHAEEAGPHHLVHVVDNSILFSVAHALTSCSLNSFWIARFTLWPVWCFILLVLYCCRNMEMV